MIKRIVLMTGGVETLTFFAKELGKIFEEKGYSVFYFNLKEKQGEFSKLKRFIKTGKTVLVTFNYIGLSEEALLYSAQYGYIWEQFEIPVYNIVVDHPLYYHSHLSKPVRRYYHIGIDRNHLAYVEKYYSDVKNCGFLPLAGTELTEEAEKRDISVLFAGNYQNPEKFKCYIERIDEEYTQFYYKIIDEILKNPKITLEEAARKFCIQEMGEISDKDFADVMAHMSFLDLYVRNTKRGNVIRTLLEAGITVDVVGNGWETLKCGHGENLKIHPQADTKTCLRLMKQAKIALNVMPEFKDGAHDRIFSSILNGAVSVSDTSQYLQEVLPEGSGICYYNINELEKLPELIESLLRSPEQRQEIAGRGYPIVKEQHIWKNRAEQFISWIEAEDKFN